MYEQHNSKHFLFSRDVPWAGWTGESVDKTGGGSQCEDLHVYTGLLCTCLWANMNCSMLVWESFTRFSEFAWYSLYQFSNHLQLLVKYQCMSLYIIIRATCTKTIPCDPRVVVWWSCPPWRWVRVKQWIRLTSWVMKTLNVSQSPHSPMPQKVKLWSYIM